MKNNNNDYEDFFFDDDQDYELDWNFGELNDHKKRDKANRIVTAISLALIAIMLIGLCLQVFGKGKVKPSEWFGKSDSQTEQTMDNITAMRFMSVSLRSASSATTYFDFDAWKTEYGADNFSRDYGEQASNFRYSSEVYLFVNGDRMDESIYVKMYAFKKADNIYNLFICFDINDKNVPSYTPDCLEYDDYRDSDKVTVIDPYMYLFVFNSLPGMDYRLYVCQRALELPPEPTKDGYTFVGWYLDEALTIPYKGEPITADMDFYAKFEINRYTVTFDSNGGSDIPSKTVDWKTAVTTETPTRTGYNFKGWFLSDGTKYTDQQIKSDTTLTARWEIVMCTVTFYVDGVKYDELSVEYGASLVSVVKRANELNLHVMSVKANGASITSFDGVTVSDDVEVQAEVMTGADKVKNNVRNNWIAIVTASVSAVVLVCAIAVLIGKFKKQYRR